MKLTDFLQDVGRPIAYYPSLRRITGSTNATIFLCQLLYWKGKESDPEGWIYKTTEQWEDETGLSYEEQKTARSKLKQAELIEEYYARLDHQMKYRPNTKAIDEKWRTWQSLVREEGKPTLGNEATPRSLNESETTTETTSQNTEEVAPVGASPTGANGVVIFREGQEYAEIPAPLSKPSRAHPGFVFVDGKLVRTCTHADSSLDADTEGNPICWTCERKELQFGKPSIKAAKMAKPKRTKPRDTRLDDPIVEAYRKIAKITPPEAIRDEMQALEGDNITDAHISKWGDVVTQWIGRGYNPRNISGMLEVYRNGWKQNGHAPKPAQPTPALPSEEELNRQRADVAAKVAARDAKRKAGIKDPDDF